MGRRMTGLVAGAIVATGAAYAVLDALDVAPGVLTSDWSVRRTAAPPPVEHVAASAVASLSPEAPTPAPRALADHVRSALQDPALGARPAAVVRDAATGKPLMTVAQRTPRTPASTLKVLTAAAVAARTDLSTRRNTRVVVGAAPGTLVLVADGDTLLGPGHGNPYAVAGHAGLGDLAAQTAAALESSNSPSDAPPEGGYRLLLDDSVAAGPAIAPEWAPADVAGGFTAPVATLGLAEDRALPGHPATSDPALTAATAFRDALRASGVAVADRVERAHGAARGSATELASVEGPTVGEALTLALDQSDNALTEAVARRAFVDQGVPPQFAAAGAHVEKVLAELGVDTTGLRLADASGLSRSSRATAETINQVTALAASRDNSPGGGTFTEVMARLPVAAWNGTLFDRFVVPKTEAGRGVVRAKTGTLTGVGALTGTLVDNSGRLLVFTVIADQAPPGAGLETRAALDRVATALVTCACSG